MRLKRCFQCEKLFLSLHKDFLIERNKPYYISELVNKETINKLFCKKCIIELFYIAKDNINNLKNYSNDIFELYNNDVKESSKQMLNLLYIIENQSDGIIFDNKL